VNDLLASTLRWHGLPVAVTPNPRLENSLTCEQLLCEAGFEQVQVAPNNSVTALPVLRPVFYLQVSKMGIVRYIGGD
jgi:hypothetical protein